MPELAVAYLVGFFMTAGLVALHIFLQIKNQVPEDKDLSLEIRNKVKDFHSLTSETFSIHLAKARTKQWLKLLSENYPLFKEIFDEIKIHEDSEDFSTALKQTL